MADEKEPANGTPEPNGTSSMPHPPTSRTGWDGKLRVNKQATLVNPEALSDPDYSDEDAPPVDQIDADEGMPHERNGLTTLLTTPDLLEGEDPAAEACACVSH